MKLIDLYSDSVLGAIKGLDRIRFRGTLRFLASAEGLLKSFKLSKLLFKDFGPWAKGKTDRLRTSCEERAEQLGIETHYLRSSAIDKETWARDIAEKKGIDEGSVCLFSVLETCIAPAVAGNKATKRLELVYRPRKCVHLYHYFNDPVVGFGHVRLQSWLPFNIHVCLNGRHWLEKQLQGKDIAYVKDRNCFPWIENLDAAQRLLDRQLKTNWAKLLNRLVLNACPALPKILAPQPFNYYWSADETEWATDILFESEEVLGALYPCFARHALLVSDSASVLRYLGNRHITRNGRCHGKLARQVTTDWRRRPEGVRVKHSVGRNSVKLYNKSGNILRVETTINNTRDFKAFRHPEDDPERAPSWLPLRKGVSDLKRRCEISDAVNERYADALCAAQVEETLQRVAARTCNPVTKQGKRYRGLNPWNRLDHQLLTFLAKGERAIAGFRNKDLRDYLYPEADPEDVAQRNRHSARVSRYIQLLRKHGLVRKVPRENRYMLTAKGTTFAAALLGASVARISQLTAMAA